jgi:fructose-1,6-bisphosphatase/inositol monophosphatase family enzyme
MDLLRALQYLEPTFLEAGQLAYGMQKNVRSYRKLETGDPVSDIVTEADLAVQELLLKAMSNTELVHCKLLAEEDTPATQLFNGTNGHYLSIDPIDDTAIYAKGGQHFSTIITLHDGKNVLYLFVYFPAWNWVHTVINGSYSVSGESPEFNLPADARKMIVYWSGNPEQNIPTEVLTDLRARGLRLSKVSNLVGFGSLGPFAAGKVAGVYRENPNTYDGLSEYAIASARGGKVYASNGSGFLDLHDVREREKGLYYEGYYLALNI